NGQHKGGQARRAGEGNPRPLARPSGSSPLPLARAGMRPAVSVKRNPLTGGSAPPPQEEDQPEDHQQRRGGPRHQDEAPPQAFAPPLHVLVQWADDLQPPADGPDFPLPPRTFRVGVVTVDAGFLHPPGRRGRAEIPAPVDNSPAPRSTFMLPSRDTAGN